MTSIIASLAGVKWELAGFWKVPLVAIMAEHPELVLRLEPVNAERTEVEAVALVVAEDAVEQWFLAARRQMAVATVVAEIGHFASASSR